MFRTLKQDLNSSKVSNQPNDSELEARIARIRAQNKEIEISHERQQEDTKRAEMRGAGFRAKPVDDEFADKYRGKLRSDRIEDSDSAIDDVEYIPVKGTRSSGDKNREELMKKREEDDQWRNERKKIDDDRVRRQKANNQGSWKREWDADKGNLSDQDDYHSYNRTPRTNRNQNSEDYYQGHFSRNQRGYENGGRFSTPRSRTNYERSPNAIRNNYGNMEEGEYENSNAGVRHGSRNSSDYKSPDSRENINGQRFKNLRENVGDGSRIYNNRNRENNAPRQTGHDDRIVNSKIFLNQQKSPISALARLQSMSMKQSNITVDENKKDVDVNPQKSENNSPRNPVTLQAILRSISTSAVDKEINDSVPKIEELIPKEVEKEHPKQEELKTDVRKKEPPPSRSTNIIPPIIESIINEILHRPNDEVNFQPIIPGQKLTDAEILERMDATEAKLIVHRILLRLPDKEVRLNNNTLEIKLFDNNVLTRKRTIVNDQFNNPKITIKDKSKDWNDYSDNDEEKVLEDDNEEDWEDLSSNDET